MVLPHTHTQHTTHNTQHTTHLFSIRLVGVVFVVILNESSLLALGSVRGLVLLSSLALFVSLLFERFDLGRLVLTHPAK
jgi:hypothetical protein